MIPTQLFHRALDLTTLSFLLDYYISSRALIHGANGLMTLGVLARMSIQLTWTALMHGDAIFGQTVWMGQRLFIALVTMDMTTHSQKRLQVTSEGSG